MTVSQQHNISLKKTLVEPRVSSGLGNTKCVKYITTQVLFKIHIDTSLCAYSNGF